MQNWPRNEIFRKVIWDKLNKNNGFCHNFQIEQGDHHALKVWDGLNGYQNCQDDPPNDLEDDQNSDDSHKDDQDSYQVCQDDCKDNIKGHDGHQDEQNDEYNDN